ncbi:50S ribosomal protein L3 [Candidatus Falkowbacteria bacterium CG10_big_fil_rev_8_21_14_0_10_44_15]|uniref:Large ribosomal subunit protein uL3 n=1 Tax=Candidatus Falkowbacteria bacterium CG10_big_fil_rev_8_21_14_0_10_44_15 TaxID=1974569 RepID=A0A2H0V0T5_9BACT|nr:MAG: 50S ribosomal protein L3 [Candidatus Falkowbacteria bacterium CG10_big_fil_rev_8_21_14_0_10_44_15]
MKFILGKKLEMTQIFQDDGTVVPVTKVQAGPCVVVQIKNAAVDGYTAVQFGYGERKIKNIAKSQQGRLSDLPKVRYLREMRIKDAAAQAELKRGQIIDVSSFAPGDIIDVTGTSKGRGFQGVVKRHGFHGMPATHGHKDQLRHSGSVGAKGPARVFKGTRMGGQMGDERITIKNLSIARVDGDNNILYITGAVPGARNGLLIIKGEGEMQIVESEESLKHESIKTLKQAGDKNDAVGLIKDNKDSQNNTEGEVVAKELL